MKYYRFYYYIKDKLIGTTQDVKKIFLIHDDFEDAQVDDSDQVDAVKEKPDAAYLVKRAKASVLAVDISKKYRLQLSAL